MKTERIICVGSFAKNSGHEMCDTGFLHVSSLVAESVICYKDTTTFPFILNKGKKYDFLKNVELRPIKVLDSNTSLKLLLSFIFAAFTNLFVYLKTSKKDIMFYFYDNVFFLHIVNMLNRILRKKVIIMCHGELDMLQTKGGGLITKMDRIILRNFFSKRKLSDNLYFLVLGDSIYKNLKPLVSDCCFERFYPIQNTFYMDAEIQPSLSSINNIFKCGIIGSCSPSKGLMDYFDFLSKLKSSGVKYEAYVIGSIDVNQYSHEINDYNIKIKTNLIKRGDYEDAIRSIDYALFFYPSNTYKLIASGAILDAICMKKPILGLWNDYLEYAINTTRHPSLIYKDVNEMSCDVINNKVRELYNQNFEDSSYHFFPENVSKQFEIILDKIDWK